MEILGSIAGSFVTSIFDHCCAPITRRIRYFKYIERNVRDLNNKMDEMKSTTNDVKSRVEAEERNLKKRTNTVQLWLDRSSQMTTLSQGIVDEFERRKMCLIGCCPNLRLRYRIGKEAIEMYSQLVEHVETKPSYDFTITPPPERVAIVEAPRIDGQNTFDRTTERIMGYIQSEKNSNEVEVIGVYGMGGVGKTTLMQNINNELQESKFEVVIMVTVSQNPNFEKIQEQIRKRLGVTEMIGVDEIISILRRKRYLLILDDVWKSFDLTLIGVPQMNNDNNSKIIVVSRDERVCINMGACKRKIEVKCLVKEEAWSLFKKTIGDSFIENPNIQSHAMDVLKWCDGLPLAIVIVARAMANNKTQRDWEDAHKVLKQLARDIGEIEEKVFIPLKFSYDRLRSNCHRDCFLYCCLYPEDCQIDKNELLIYWFGEGILGENLNLNLSDARSKGNVLIHSLVESGMLEIVPDDDDDSVRMHDVMRELAIWITSKTIDGPKIVLTSRGLREAPEAKEWELANRISLTDNEICTLPQIQECPQLSTLWLSFNEGLKEIPSIGFFECMPNLRVLDLSFTSILSLPPSFSQLVNLRVLLLYNISELKQIPHIGSLQQLRILNLSRSGIMELPEGLDSLTRLRMLDISETPHLSIIQPGILAKLSRLEELYLRNYEQNLAVVLEDSKDLYNLTTLALSTNNDSLLQGNAFSVLGSRQQLKIYLVVSDCKDLAHIPPLNNLIKLGIEYCDDFERVFLEEGNSLRFQRLEALWLRSLRDLLVLYDGSALPKGCFSKLKEIGMYKCPKIKKLFSAVIMPNLPSLIKFDIQDCDELEEIFGGQEGGEVGLPSLRRLTLAGLPEFTSISPCVLNTPASLEFVWIEDCPKLNKLPLGTHHNQCLKIIKGQREWWDDLQWEDESIKYALQPYFFEI